MAKLFKALLLVISLPVLASPLDHAHVLFRRGLFAETIATLGSDISTKEAKWLKAESLFRLGQLRSAREIYKTLAEHEADKAQAKKAHLRIFECDRKLGDLPSVIKEFNSYQKRYKKIPERMSYAMAKFLYDRGYHKYATQILKKIPLNNEFGMRAHYLVGVMQLDQWSNAQAVEHFALVAASKPVSVEDYTVQQLAAIAQGRIWADAHDFIAARKAYEQVSLTGAYAEQATQELVQTMLYWAETLGADKENLAKEALDIALGAMARYRKFKEPSFDNADLQLQMARLLTKTRRYQDAKLILSELIQRYRNIPNLINVETQGSPYENLPKALVQKLPDLSPVLALKDRIDAGRTKISELSERGEVLPQLLERQRVLESGYQELVNSVQENIKRDLAPLISKTIAEAEFRQGEVAAQEMQNLRKQLDAVGKFQTEKIMNFEKNAAEIGGSS